VWLVFHSSVCLSQISGYVDSFVLDAASSAPKQPDKLVTSSNAMRGVATHFDPMVECELLLFNKSTLYRILAIFP
jgi:hypothetical protein